MIPGKGEGTSARCAVGSLACGPLRSPAAGDTAQPVPSS